MKPSHPSSPTHGTSSVSIQPIKTDQAPAAIGPYSQAIRSGSLVFVSGQIPIDPLTGQLVDGTIEQQTQQCLKNLKAILDASGSSLSKVIKTTVFLKDLEHFARVNSTYGEFFTAPYPARACVEVARLPKDVAIEIDCIASCS